MLNKPAVDVQQGEVEEDVRIERSARALHGAMSALLQEQPFDRITVQQIIERAGVSRATFYARFRSKDDALYASFERMFNRLAAGMTASPRDQRLAPVTELLEHFATAGPVRDSLTAAGKLEEILELTTDFLADLVERRLPIVMPMPPRASLPARLAARMLAGALLEMTRWWLDKPARSTPAALDAEFHAMARRMLAVPT